MFSCGVMREAGRTLRRPFGVGGGLQGVSHSHGVVCGCVCVCEMLRYVGHDTVTYEEGSSLCGEGYVSETGRLAYPDSCDARHRVKEKHRVAPDEDRGNAEAGRVGVSLRPHVGELLCHLAAANGMLGEGPDNDEPPDNLPPEQGALIRQHC